MSDATIFCDDLQATIQHTARQIHHCIIYLERAGYADTIPDMLAEISEVVEALYHDTLALSDCLRSELTK